MIRPPGFRAALFGLAAVGDVRRSQVSAERLIAAGSPDRFAYANQAHGAEVLEASAPGLLGDGDAIVTTTPDLAIVVATADCVPIVLEGAGFAAVIHAGWRGAAAGVVGATLDVLEERGLEPLRAAIGPAIGPCCYEVGNEVAATLSEHVAQTDWQTTSVDLPGAVAAALAPMPTWVSGRCTRTDPDLYSFRRDRTAGRQVAVAWLPPA